MIHLHFVLHQFIHQYSVYTHDHSEAQNHWESNSLHIHRDAKTDHTQQSHVEELSLLAAFEFYGTRVFGAHKQGGRQKSIPKGDVRAI